MKTKKFLLPTIQLPKNERVLFVSKALYDKGVKAAEAKEGGFKSVDGELFFLGAKVSILKKVKI